MAPSTDSLFELRLLRTSLSGASTPPTTPDDASPQALHLADTLLRLIEAGRYLDALRSSGARLVLGPSMLPGADQKHDDPQHYYQGVREKAQELRETEGGPLLTTAVGVAALYAFVQVNILGPQAQFPPFPLASSAASETAHGDTAEQETSDDFADFAASIQSSTSGETADSAQAGPGFDWDDWARRELVIDGTDVVGRYALPQYLLLARILLVEPHVQNLGASPTTEVPPPLPSGESASSQSPNLPQITLTPPENSSAPLSGYWWAARTLLVEQRLLAEHSASLRGAIFLLLPAVLESFGSAQAAQRSIPAGDAWKAGEAGVVAGVACLEAGLAQHAYRQTDAAAALFERAARESGLEIEVTGALGYRTPHQVDAKAQMVVRTATTGPAATYDSDPDEPTTSTPPPPESLLPKDKFAADTEVFMQPRLVPSAQPDSQRLTSIAQCLLLAHCLDVRKQSPSDELIAWQAAPFLEAVQAQKRQRPGVRAAGGLARARWERHRGRTRERAFLTMQQLVDELSGADIPANSHPATAASRLRYGLSVWFPSWPALQKELGEEMVRNGMVGAALDVFERLELWDNLIYCLKGLGKVAQATSLVRARLEVSPKDPRLWCSLGDLTLDDACYTKAWEVSAHRHARAQRSLAKSAQGRGDFAAAIRHWELALAINPLFSGAWFELAFAALKEGDDKRAINALTRTVQLEPDNGEAWNNIGALNLKADNFKEAYIALQEAVKYRHDQWQSWENLGKAALGVRAYGQACRATAKVLDLSRDKRLDVSTLRRLVEWVEHSRKSDASGAAHSAGAPPEPSGGMGPGFKSGPVTTTVEEVSNSVNEPEGLSAADVAAAVHAAADGGDEEESGSGGVAESGPEEGGELASERELSAVGELLKRAVGSGEGGAEVWGLQARFFEATGDVDMAKESRLKQVRALQSSSWQHEDAGFEAMAAASIALADVYMASSAAAAGQGAGREKRELGAARLQLRGVIKQAQERFSGTASYAALEGSLAKVEEALKNLSSG